MQKIEVYGYSHTGELIGKRIANADDKGVLLSPNCTTVVPPEYIEHVNKPVWNGTSWELKEDHRQP